METITKEQGDEIISLLKQILANGGVGGGSGGGFITTKGTDPNFREGVFTAGSWKAERVPSWASFDGGIQFGDLSGKSLAYWTNTWEPRPYKTNPIKPEDAALRKLLDQAKAEVESGAYVPPQSTNKPKEPKSERKPKSTPPPAADGGTGDEDVPF